MVECLVANEDAAGSIPADRSTRRWYMGCASAFQAEEADSISARRSRFSVMVQFAVAAALRGQVVRQLTDKLAATKAQTAPLQIFGM